MSVTACFLTVDSLAARRVTCMWVQVTRAEFVLLWATYLAIMFSSLEAGIGIGIILATFYFAFSYARVTTPPALLGHLSAITLPPGWLDLETSLQACTHRPMTPGTAEEEPCLRVQLTLL